MVTGIGIGIFYFSVAETVIHFEPGLHGNRYYGRYVASRSNKSYVATTVA